MNSVVRLISRVFKNLDFFVEFVAFVLILIFIYQLFLFLSFFLGRFSTWLLHAMIVWVSSVIRVYWELRMVRN